MNLAADLPVTLVVKAANQRVADQTVECVLGWTIRKLKQHLEAVYPSKPKHHQQKLIYSGMLLADHLTLKEVLRQYDMENSQHTVHLVCSPSAESQPGPFPSSGENKSHPRSSASHSSVSSSDETDGLRHRGPQLSNAVSSTSDVSNTRTSPAMPDAVVMPGMENVPMMGIPGYPYTPEQIAWMQQMYSQYMNQYMQYYGYQMPAAPPQPHQVQAPVPQAVVNPAPNNNPPAANQNVRMNAQGGLEEDDEEEQRDWLDYIYLSFRFLILVSIVYFYSSAYRFVTVLLGFIGLWLVQNGWLIFNRRQQPPAQRQPAAQQPNQQQQQQPEEQLPVQQRQQPPDGDQNEIQQNERENSAEQGDASETSSESTEQAPPPPDTPSMATILFRMLMTFFTSLVPVQPPTVNGN